MACPPLKNPDPRSQTKIQCVGEGTRRGYRSPGDGYWAETRPCPVLIPGWQPFTSNSPTSAPAPWSPLAGSSPQLTASTASMPRRFLFQPTLQSSMFWHIVSVFLHEKLKGAQVDVKEMGALKHRLTVVAEQGLRTERARDLQTLTPQHQHCFMNRLYLDKHSVRGKPKNVLCADAVYVSPFDVDQQASLVIVKVQRSSATALNHDTLWAINGSLAAFKASVQPEYFTSLWSSLIHCKPVLASTN